MNTGLTPVTAATPMSKVGIILGGKPSAALLVALLLHQRAIAGHEDPIIVITGDPERLTAEPEPPNPISEFFDPVECFECGDELERFGQCPTCNPVLPHEE